jgi:IS1 family transposase/transposase-like protein
MIQVVITKRCPQCNSTNLVRNGHDYKGAQKFHCKDCDAYGTLDATGRYSQERQAEILRSYRERSSMRGVSRIFGVTRQTLARWLVELADALPDLSTTLFRALRRDVLELDELWSFVLKKANKRWVWIALCRRTRQIVAHYIGDRSEQSCRELWKRIPPDYKRCHSFSDFWAAYQKVFASGKHQSVGKETGQTAHVERWINTLRQRIARFVRKTLSFSKSERYHEIVFKIFVYFYNLDVASPRCAAHMLSVNM